VLPVLVLQHESTESRLVALALLQLTIRLSPLCPLPSPAPLAGAAAYTSGELSETLEAAVNS